MPATRMQKTRNRLAKIYGIGIIAFTVILGFITALAKFLAHVNMA